MTDFAIGVVSQGIQICSVIATYISTLKDCDEDLASIDRQAQGLETVFRTLKESLTQGSLDPSTSPAAAQVLSSMQTCEAELNSLKQLAARFSDNPSLNARPQDKIKQQVKKLRYPIRKPDICRIQKSLGVVKETLDLALQNLELSYSCLATSKLSNLEAASQQASDSLAALDSGISTLHTKLDDLLDRLQQNDTTVAAALDEHDPRKAIYKLAYKPSNLAALCASLESTINILRAAPTAETSGQSLGANLEYRATVDRRVSPAFRVMSVLDECADMLYHKLEVQQIKNQVQWERLTLSASHKLEYLFRLGKASAKDVDSRNRTLLHAAAEVASSIYLIMDWDWEIGEAYSLPVIHLATLLVKRQASASLLDLDGQQALAIATPREPLSGPLIEAFYTSDADIQDSNPYHAFKHFEPQKLAQTFSRYATMLRVADDAFVLALFGDKRPVNGCARGNGEELEYGNALRREHHHAAIRSITFDALGIAHTCMCREDFRMRSELDPEEIAEIQDEYAELLELLESLIEEFETHAFKIFDAATDGLDFMITFWNGYWIRRMNEVLSELSRAGEASNAAAEDLGVVWGPQTEREMYKKREWKGWDYFFQKIEEIE
ncbi:hypothetical protein V8C40DRAFT_282460 [Trichoderma camerunense]